MSIIRGATYLMIGSFIAQALSAVTGLLIARLAGLDAYGQYATAFALAGAFAQAFLFGLDSILPREIARRPTMAAHDFINSLIPVLAWSALITIGIVLVGIQLGYSNIIISLLMMAAPIFALRALINLGRAALRGLERMEKDALIQVIETLLVLAAVALTFVLSQSILRVILAMLVAEMLALGYTALLLRRHLTGSFQIADRTSIQLLTAAAPLGVTFMLIGFSFRLDTIILSAHRAETEVGIYSAAFGVIVLSSAISLVSAALLPRLSALATSNRDEFGALWNIGLRYTLIIGLCAGMSISWLAPWLIQLLYGSAFTRAIPVLRILGIVATLLFINRYLWHVLIALGKEKSILYSAIVSALATLFCGLALIPTWGIYGTAMAAIVRETCQLFVLGFFAFRYTPPIRIKKTVAAPISASLAMLGLLIFVQSQHESATYTLLMLPIAILLYFALLLVTKGIQRSELAVWSKRLALLAVVVGSAGLFVDPLAAKATQSCPSAYQLIDNNGNGRAEGIHIDINFSSATQDRITVYWDPDQMDERLGSPACWTDYVDYIDETWLFDAGNNGDANLVIFFERVGNAVTAKLYDDQDGNNAVEYALHDGQVMIQEKLPKTKRAAAWSVQVLAPAGWWVRHDDSGQLQANYNLNFSVNGNIEAIFGTNQFADILQNDDEIDFSIEVYDVDNDGRPDHDLRFLPELPRLSGLGGFNTHLMMNLADNEEVIQPDQIWPYLGISEGLSNNVIQRSNSARRPPILIDWNSSKIVAIHEMVASRAGENNCFFYSSIRPQSGAPSPMNFEAPFCFYDLAGDQDVIPELIIRNQYWTPNDAIFMLGQFPHPLAQVRYSWDQNNDGALDFALGLTARKIMDKVVRVLDYELKTVPYSEFPAWAVQNRWDTAVFVAAEKDYFSNEGIYEVDLPLDLVANYLTGRTVEMPGAQIDDYMAMVISNSTRGLRLERNLHFDQQPQLYFSPIDGQTHLLNATDGIWQLQEGGAIYYTNLDADPYIDQWQYVDEQGATQTLIQSRGWLIRAGNDKQIWLVQNTLGKAVLSFTPPQDQSAYDHIGTQISIAQQAWQASQPNEVSSVGFLGAATHFNGNSIRLTGVQMEDFRITDSGFRFILDATSISTNATQLLAGHKLEPMRYVVTAADGSLSLSPFTPAQPSFTLDKTLLPPTWIALQPYSIAVIGANLGQEDLSPLNVTLTATDEAGNEIAVASSKQSLLAETTTKYLYSWMPPHAGEWILSVKAETDTETFLANNLHSLNVAPPLTPTVPWFFKQLSTARWGLLLLAISMATIALGILLFIMPSLQIQSET